MAFGMVGGSNQWTALHESEAHFQPGFFVLPEYIGMDIIPYRMMAQRWLQVAFPGQGQQCPFFEVERGVGRPAW